MRWAGCLERRKSSRASELRRRTSDFGPRLEVSRLEKEVEALCGEAPLLSEDGEGEDDNQPTLPSSTALQQPIKNL
jgi:hypothetical protein